MIDFVPMAYAATSRSTSSDLGVAGLILAALIFVWEVIYVIQAILGYGTAYRKTKANGDNGVSLFGWMIVYCSLAALVPGLGIYLWKKSKNDAQPNQPVYQQQVYQQPVYQQQPDYQQQVYQQTDQVYQQTAQPVYQQPVDQTAQQQTQPVYQQPVDQAVQQPTDSNTMNQQ